MATTDNPHDDAVSSAGADTDGGHAEREPDPESDARDQRWVDAAAVHWHASTYTPETQHRADIEHDNKSNTAV
ncbi:hypothetical protein [Leifsonia sp. EB34]|uniref:hypothetical protein n=1 Tax=Leifsonia sp. EB34 TaxID=3156303 RepID=UPI0035196259